MSTSILPRSKPSWWDSPDQIVGRLLARHDLSVTGDLRHALSPDCEADYFAWEGEYPGDDVGRYWIPALFPVSRLHQAIRLIRTEHDKHKGCTEEEAITLMRRWHTGLGKRFVALNPWAYTEIDHLPRAEQEARYAALAIATGLRWCLQVFTGGKSVHGYIAFKRPLTATDPLRLEIQMLLAVLLDGDTKIVDPGRLMRLPGWVGPRRSQPVVHFDADAAFEPEDVRDRLLALADSQGIEEVLTAYKTLQLAERVAKAAEKSFGEAAMELQAHADLLRATKAVPATDDLEIGRLMTGGMPQQAGMTVSSTPGGFERADSTLGEWAGLVPGRHDYCPWCDSSSPRVLSVVTGAGGLVATCFKEDVTRHSAWATDTQSPPVDLDTLLDDWFSEDGVVDNEDEESDITEADRLVEALEAAAERSAVPELPDDVLDDILADFAGGDVRPSLYRSPNRLRRTHEVEDQSSGAEEDEANAHFQDLGGHAVWCPRGPNQHVAVGEREAVSSRLACNAYGCYVCGPRQVYALRGSARTVVRRMASGWSGTTFGLTESSDTLLRALRRWVAKAPEQRAAIGFAITPEKTSYLAMWGGDDHRPVGALVAHLEAVGAVLTSEPLHEVIDRMGAEIDLVEWTLSERKAVILRGTKNLRHRVADLRDRVLGRSRARRDKDEKPDPNRVVVRTYTTLSETQEEASRRAFADTQDTEVEVSNRTRTQTTRWGFTDNTPVRPFLKQMMDEGWFKKLGSPASPSDGIDELLSVPPIQVSGDLGDAGDDDLDDPVFQDGVGEARSRHIDQRGEQVFEGAFGLFPAALVNQNHVEPVEPAVPDQRADQALHDPPPPLDGEPMKGKDQGIGPADDVEGIHDHRDRKGRRPTRPLAASPSPTRAVGPLHFTN